MQLLRSVSQRNGSPEGEPRRSHPHTHQQEGDRHEAGERESAVATRDGNLPRRLSSACGCFAGYLGTGVPAGACAALGGTALLPEDSLLASRCLCRILLLCRAACPRDTRDGETGSGPAQQEATHQHRSDRNPRSHKATPSGPAPTLCLGGHCAELDAIQLERCRPRDHSSQPVLDCEQVCIDELSRLSIHHRHIRTSAVIP